MDASFFLWQTEAPAVPGGGQTAQAPKGAEGDAPAAQPQSPGSMWGTMIPFLLMFVVMYFLLIKPQRRQAKERETMITTLKKNDHVVTSGGIHGIVKQVKPDDPDVTLVIDEKQDVCIRVTKAAIAGLVKSSGAEGKTNPEPEKAKS